MNSNQTYKVIHAGKLVGSFPNFSEAWVYVCLGYRKLFSIISGPDGYWIINPPLAN